jgi:hypothetical protein
MSPERRVLPDGPTVTMNSLGKRSPRGCFQEYDLYSTRFGTVINDEVEKFLFGSIDTRGARGVWALASGDPSETHHAFQDFFEFRVRLESHTERASLRVSSITEAA